MSHLSLFVWVDAYDHVPYGGGIAFALAHDVDEARQLITRDATGCYRQPNLSNAPDVYCGQYGNAYSWEE